jgi:small subunit ribosomal protein S7e
LVFIIKIFFLTKIVFSRTLTAVHDAILHDLVYPAEITGKRIRIKLDGSRLFKVHLDKNQQTLVETKV